MSEPIRSAPEEIQRALFWGMPIHQGEGLLFEGINLTPGPKSVADWFHRSEKLPNYSDSRAPQQDYSDGQLVVPYPPTSRQGIQEPFVGETENPPEQDYPDGYYPDLSTEWPTDSDLVAPVEHLADFLVASMGESRRDKQEQKKHISELTGDDET